MADKTPKLSYQDVVEKWKARGYPEASAKGIADNVMRESSGDPAEMGDHGTSGGLYQHHNERLDALKKFATDQKKDWKDPDVQTDFADHELKTDYPALRAKLMKGDDRGVAEDSFKRIFERPASVLWANGPNGAPVLGNPRFRFSDAAMRGADGKSIRYMSPEDYLALSPDMEGEPWKSRQGRALRNSLLAGDDVENLPSLGVKIDGPTATVTEQDGRHRALAAKEAGVDMIPVKVDAAGEGDPKEIVGMSGAVLPNTFPKGDAVQTEKSERGLLGKIKDAIIPGARAAEGSADPWAEFNMEEAPKAKGLGKAADPWAEFNLEGSDQQTSRGSAASPASGPMAPGTPGSFLRPAPSSGDNMLASAINGAAYGLGRTALGGQELVGQGLRGLGAEGVGNWLVNDARQGVAKLGAEMAPDTAAHPVASVLGEMGGSAVLPGGIAGRLGGGAVRAGLAGGALSGLLEPTAGEGGEYAANKAAQVAAGAGIGGALGGATLGASKAAQGLYRYLVKAKGPEAATSEAAQTILSRIAADEKGGGPSAQDMLDLMAAAPEKPQTVMDVGGNNLRSLGGRMARAPGEASSVMRNFLTGRDLGAGPRLDTDITAAIGGEAPGENAFEALKQARSAAAQPLFEKAYQGGSTAPLERQFENAFGEATAKEAAAAQALAAARTEATSAAARGSMAGDNVYANSAANERAGASKAAMESAQAGVDAARAEKEQARAILQRAQADGTSNAPGAVWNPRIQQFLENPRVQQGLHRGLRIERDNALAEGRKMNPSEYAIVGVDQEGEPIVGTVPTMRLLAVAKEGLDRMVQSPEFQTQFGTLNKEGVAIDRVRGAFLSELDKINPAYRAARAQWGGDSQSLSAFQAGEKIFRANPRETQALVAGLSPDSKEFLRLGAARALRDSVARKGAGGDEAKAIIGSQYVRNQIRPLFDDESAYQKFISSVEAEGRMFSTKFGAVGGSQTAERGAEDMSPAVQALMHGGYATTQAARGNYLGAFMNMFRAMKDMVAPPNPMTNPQISRMLTATPQNPTGGSGVNVMNMLRTGQAPPGPSLNLSASPWVNNGSAVGAAALGGAQGFGGQAQQQGGQQQ